MTIVLPSGLFPPTTEEVGYFDVKASVYARRLAKDLGPDWQVNELLAPSLYDAVQAIYPLSADRSRFLVLPVDGWSVVMNNFINGTDLGVIPSLEAREYGNRAIRAAAAASHATIYPATILEVYGPEAKGHRLACRRTLYAANDGGRWVFGESGERYDFEEVEQYAKRRIRDRFTSEMLGRYLEALGVPATKEPDVAKAFIIEKRNP